MPIETAIPLWRKAFVNNAVTTSYDSVVNSLVEPATAGMIDVPNTPGNNTLLFMPFGTGSANDTFALRLIGWRELQGQAGWFYHDILIMSCTLGTAVGVAGAGVTASDKFCDAVTVTGGTDAHEIMDVTANTPILCSVDVMGASNILPQVDRTGASSGNFIYAFI